MMNFYEKNKEVEINFIFLSIMRFIIRIHSKLPKKAKEKTLLVAKKIVK